jgi:hypothetical protein
MTIGLLRGLTAIAKKADDDTKRIDPRISASFPGRVSLVPILSSICSCSWPALGDGASRDSDSEASSKEERKRTEGHFVAFPALRSTPFLTSTSLRLPEPFPQSSERPAENLPGYAHASRTSEGVGSSSSARSRCLKIARFDVFVVQWPEHSWSPSLASATACCFGALSLQWIRHCVRLHRHPAPAVPCFPSRARSGPSWGGPDPTVY